MAAKEYGCRKALRRLRPNEEMRDVEFDGNRFAAFALRLRPRRQSESCACRVFTEPLSACLSKPNGIRPGKFKFRGKKPKTATIVLCGASAPAFGVKALDWVNRSLGLSLDLKEVPKPQDFTPDPLKPVPPGRTPRNLELHRCQADFLSELRIAEKRPVPPVNSDRVIWRLP